MIIRLLGLIFQFAGTLIIAITVWRVHGHVHMQKKINKKVLIKMKHARFISLIGIFSIIVGFILSLFDFLAQGF